MPAGHAARNGLFYVSDLMGGAKTRWIGNVIKVQFLNIRDRPFAQPPALR